MLRNLVTLLAVGALAGCQAGASFDPNFSRGNDVNTERLAAYAAQAEYPREAQASDELRAAALIDRDRGTIRILNFGDRPLNDAVVWVNGAFVHRVGSIPPTGSVTIPRASFYDARGNSLAKQQTSANRVQIQWGNELYNLLGPVYE
jgi:hypothetical protein